MNATDAQIIGFAWYSEEEWLALRRVSADKDRLDDSYAEWLAGAEKALRTLQSQGAPVIPVSINVSELVAWCKAENRRIDGSARSAFAALKVEENAAGFGKATQQLLSIKVPRRRNPLPLLTQLEGIYEKERDRSEVPPYPYDEKRSLVRLPASVVAELRQMIRAGSVPGAVKLVEKLTGAGLRVAKDYVDILRDRL